MKVKGDGLDKLLKSTEVVVSYGEPCYTAGPDSA